MKLGSLFDGSGGFPLAGTVCGIEHVWASEIEPYPLKVTAARFPHMIQLGDVTKINGAEIEPVDVITFGSPCQDLSVAGKQAGIHDGERSNLFFEAIRIIKEMRANDRAAGRADEHCRPRFAVWENVPGAFNSNKGADFQAVLQALCEVTDTGVSVPLPEKGKWQKAGCIVGDGYSVAWRVYDAQFWGVPQRRKRIYLVADFGSERAGEILFEREGVRGNTEASHEAWEKLTAHAAGGATRGYSYEPVSFKSIARNGKVLVDQANTICASDYKDPDVVVFAPNGNHCGVFEKTEISATLTTKYHYGSGGDAALAVYDCRGNGNGETVPTLTGDHQNRVTDYSSIAVYPKITGALCANSHPGSYTGQDAFNDMLPVIKTDKPPRKYIVRRLTPLECCRLQGFPDWWEDGVEGSDSARYKMWGNGIALPCAVDVLWRIAHA